MSRFLALHYFDKRPVSRDSLAQVIRCKDGSEPYIYVSDSFGFAAAGANQPEDVSWSAPSGGGLSAAVVCTGEVYNRDEFPAFNSQCASLAELVVELYRREGEAGAARLKGDYAFCLWDSRRQRLCCGRDVLGWRPLFYYRDEECFAAATELRLLHAAVLKPLALNLGWLGEYLIQELVSTEETLWKGVYRLLPGSLLTLSGRTLAVKQVQWLLDGGSAAEQAAGEQEAADRLRLLPRDAAERRLPIDEPWSISLSGGLDSSSLAALLADRRPRCFTLTFPGRSCDERALVEAVSRQHGLSVEYQPAAVERTVTVESEIRRWRDVPNDPNAFLVEQVRRLAVLQGTPLVCTGYGGDELLGAVWHSYSGLLQRGELRRLLRQCAADARIRDSLSALLPRPLKQTLQRAIPAFRWLPAWTTERFARDTDIDARLRAPYQPPAGLTMRQQISHCWLLNGQALHMRELDQRIALCTGTAARHPFLDSGVMRFCLSLPGELLSRGEKRKYILRRAMSGLLPEEILARQDKAEFSFLWPVMLEQAGGRRAVFSSPIFELGWLEREMLEQRWDKAIAAFQSDADAVSADLYCFWSIYAAGKVIECLG